MFRIQETDLQRDERFMRMALEEAREAFDSGEIPVGAVIVSQGRVIARGHNMTETLNDVTAHAEMIALTSAANNTGGKYLPKATIYVTVEPCTMCAGALGWSQIGRIVYGAPDLKRGFFSTVNPGLSTANPDLSTINPGKSPIHPKTTVSAGVLEDECADLMKAFFQNLRR